MLIIHFDYKETSAMLFSDFVAKLERLATKFYHFTHVTGMGTDDDRLIEAKPNIFFFPTTCYGCERHGKTAR